MNRIVRALSSYATRRFPSYTPPSPPRRRSAVPLSDSHAVVHDFRMVVNDLNIATRRIMRRYNYKPEQGELFSEP